MRDVLGDDDAVDVLRVANLPARHLLDLDVGAHVNGVTCANIRVDVGGNFEQDPVENAVPLCLIGQVGPGDGLFEHDLKVLETRAGQEFGARLSRGETELGSVLKANE